MNWLMGGFAGGRHAVGHGRWETRCGRAADPAWVIDVEGYDPLRENSVASRFAISNGLLGIPGPHERSCGARVR